MNNSVFRKIMENIRKHKDINLVTTEAGRNVLITEPNYKTTNFLSKNLLGIEMRRTKMIMNKPVYLGLVILEISKIALCEFWYDYAKPKCDKRAKLCYMGTDSVIAHVKTEDIYKYTAKDVEKRFDTSNYESEKTLPKGKKTKKVISFMKDEISRKNIKEYSGL